MRPVTCDTRRMNIASANSHSEDSSAVVVRPLTVRSAVTNDPLLLRGVDGRSMIARRYRDVAIALADDLGGQDKRKPPARAAWTGGFGER
jgi:hypothetical protein